MKLHKFFKNDTKKKISFFMVGLTIILLGCIIVAYYKSHAYYKSEKTYNVIEGKIPTFQKDDIVITYTVDGEVASSFPETHNYDVTVDCGDTADAEWDSDKWGLYILDTSSSKVTCNISFEKKILASYITKLASTDTVNLVADDETEDHNIRYIGADPSNYLCFDEDCSNGKWRVIGLMNNMRTESNGIQSLVKIIKADRVGLYVWDSNSVNDWSTASLKDELNVGAIYESYIEDYNVLFESVTWNLGGWSTSSITPSEYYIYERGTEVYSGRPTTWTGKIALMYPSDYGYATSGGDTTDRALCLSTQLYSWNSYSDCYENDYLFDSSTYQWTLTPYSSHSDSVVIVRSEGYVYGCYASPHGPVRPVGYLISTASILSGEGTSDSPWIISMS
jgi:hypothetical protein